MSAPSQVTTLAVIRLAVGGGSWLAPKVAGGAFGLDAEANPQSPYLARLFGVRDAALGVGLLTTTGEARKQWLKIGIACDAADLVAGVAGGRAGYLSKTATALVSVAALTAIATGSLGLREGD
jgi:hypothetical protein